MKGKPGVATDAPEGGKPMLTLLRSISGAFRPVSHESCLSVHTFLQLHLPVASQLVDVVLLNSEWSGRLVPAQLINLEN